MDYKNLTFDEYIKEYNSSLEGSRGMMSQLNTLEKIKESEAQATIHLALRWYATKNENLLSALEQKAKDGELSYKVEGLWSNLRNTLSLTWKDKNAYQTLNIPLYDRTPEELKALSRITRYLPDYDRSKEKLSTLYEDRKAIEKISDWIEKGLEKGHFPEKVEEETHIPENIAIIQTINDLHHLQLSARLDEENSSRERDPELYSIYNDITSQAKKLKDQLGTFALRNDLISKKEYDAVMPIEQARARHDRI